MNIKRLFLLVLWGMFISTMLFAGNSKSYPGLYKTKCGRCHSLKDPAEYGKSEWDKEVRRMAKRAGVNQSELNIIIGLRK